MKTKDRILQTSLNLFNRLGERNVSTNLIASELTMSPGNLYYHFKNKQEIVYSLFKEFETAVNGLLALPDNRDLTVFDKVAYLTDVFEEIWNYRFLHRDMESLMAADNRLRHDSRQMFMNCMNQIYSIYEQLNRVGIISVSDTEMQDMTLNIWIIVTSWCSFLKSSVLTDETIDIPKELLQRGIYQVVSIERPYLTDKYKDLAELAGQQGGAYDLWMKGSASQRFEDSSAPEQHSCSANSAEAKCD